MSQHHPHGNSKPDSPGPRRRKSALEQRVFHLWFQDAVRGPWRCIAKGVPAVIRRVLRHWELDPDALNVQILLPDEDPRGGRVSHPFEDREEVERTFLFD
jgi:hypothetical protein